MRAAVATAMTRTGAARAVHTAPHVAAGAALTRAAAATWRVERIGRPLAAPAVYVFPHAAAWTMAAAHAGWDVSVLISRHRSADVFAQIARSLGFHVVRGSTSRGGADAVFALARALRGGRAVAIAPDGPRGPAGSVAAGAVDLAWRARVALVPVGCAARPAWSVHSWDRLFLPAPGARVAIVFGEPRTIPREASAVTRDAHRRGAQDALAQAGACARSRVA